jgi:hypothetical protein
MYTKITRFIITIQKFTRARALFAHVSRWTQAESRMSVSRHSDKLTFSGSLLLVWIFVRTVRGIAIAKISTAVR